MSKQLNGKVAKHQAAQKRCEVYALAQQKGGVGKTTTTINLGAAMAELGMKVLLIDLDPQGALSAGVGINSFTLSLTIYDALRDPNQELSGIILSSEIGCDIAPANIDLAAAEIQLVSEPGRERILKEKLAKVVDSYDLVLIDCPPSLGLLTLNALAASTGVIVPVQTQYFALRGMEMLFKTVEKVKMRINPDLRLVGILPTIYDSRTIHAKEVLEELRKAYGTKVLQTVIPQTVKLADSTMAGRSILSHNSASPAAKAYRDLAKEVVELA
ncbi:MAG: ParA family protein [Blastocatellia bacterium]|nr:ParA family protein [Blastocatellia bacterium]